MASRRRVSYVVPTPTEPVPRLQLPPYGISRLGSTGPLLIPADSSSPSTDEAHKWSRYPRHRLGVSSLALDCSTQLAGRAGPEGILYSGGRDGLLISWDLRIPMKKRQKDDAEVQPRSGRRWELMTGWADDVIDEEGEEDERFTSGDILGDVTGTMSKRSKPSKSNDNLPYEQQWETDLEVFQPGQPSSFRQCAQMHTDWINDIILCNYNQTVVSASSDGTLRTWNPHSHTSSEPSTLGTHSDYVRCLAYCREQNWIASGSFDRTVKLWDLSRTSNSDALVTLNPTDTSAPKSSVYAIAADPFGHAIATGSPEKTVRMWDPRSGKRTCKLVGHTDNIRAILISEDSRYLLTGSADASVKLWSLASQRCLHTFTYHTDSVWSLFSSHPSLEVFYSGDRTGLVCKVDVEDCTDVSEGECILLCQDSDGSNNAEGINKIVAMDDNLLWTASGCSMIRRWRVPQRRAVRANALILDPEADRYPLNDSPVSGPFTQTRVSIGDSSSFSPSLKSDHGLPFREREDESTLYGVPFESLVKLTSPNDPFASYTPHRGRDPEVATLYSAASIMSVPKANPRSPMQSSFGHRHSHHRPGQSHSHSLGHSHTSPIRSSRTEDTIFDSTARAKYEEREIAADATPLYHEPDDVIRGNNGLVRSIMLNDRIHVLTVDTSGEVAVWDIVRCVCKGRFSKNDVAVVSMNGSAGSAGNSNGGEEHGRRISPREALESIRERIEGEVVVLRWATVDTKGGVLTVHVTERCFDAEVYADEVGFVHDRYVNDESKLNIGKWVLRNLFLAFIREEQRLRRKRERSNSHDGNYPRDFELSKRSPKSPSVLVMQSPKMIPATAPAVSSSARTSPLLTPMIPLVLSKENSLPLPAIPQSPNSNDATPMPRRVRSGTMDSTQQATAASSTKDLDYFSVPTRKNSLPGVGTPDEFSGWGGPGRFESGPQTPITPSGLIGRLKGFGKTKKAASDTPSSPAIGPVTAALETTFSSEDTTVGDSREIKNVLQTILAGPLTPPPSNEAPLHSLPAHITLTISEETSSGFTTVYRGTVNSAGYDVSALEETLPLWLIEYLLTNKVPSPPPIVKVSFILLPWPNKDSGGEQLPELLNITQSKLTASRWLRVRKLVNHVNDRLEKIASNSATDSTRTSIDSQSTFKSARPAAEDLFEILCNDVPLPLDMTLATVRQYIWRQSSELMLYYRSKIPAVVA